MSNPYLAVLATPPTRERFGFVPLAGGIVALAALSPVAAAFMNTYYAPDELQYKDAETMVLDGQKPLPFANKSVPGGFGITNKVILAPRSVANASLKAAWILGALSRHTQDRRFADKGADLLNQLQDKFREQSNETNGQRISEFYSGVIAYVIPMLKGRENDAGVRYLLGLMAMQMKEDLIRASQARKGDQEAGLSEFFERILGIGEGGERGKDTCFESKEAREKHEKWKKMVPDFLQEPDPNASPPGCKNRLKTWVVPTGVGLGVGVFALIFIGRRRSR